MKCRQTTTTTLVVEKLRACDDLLDAATLANATGRSLDRVYAALAHLQRCRVVEVIVNGDGRRWWMAAPPSSDARMYTIEEIVPDYKKPRRRRKGKDA